MKSGRSLMEEGKVYWEACLDEATLALYILAESIAVFIRAYDTILILHIYILQRKERGRREGE